MREWPYGREAGWNANIQWSQKKDDKCRSSAMADVAMGNPIESVEYNHEPDATMIRVTKTRLVIKNKAATSRTKAVQIYSDSIATFRNNEVKKWPKRSQRESYDEIGVSWAPLFRIDVDFIIFSYG